MQVPSLEVKKTQDETPRVQLTNMKIELLTRRQSGTVAALSDDDWKTMYKLNLARYSLQELAEQLGQLRNNQRSDHFKGFGGTFHLLEVDLHEGEADEASRKSKLIDELGEADFVGPLVPFIGGRVASCQNLGMWQMTGRLCGRSAVYKTTDSARDDMIEKAAGLVMTQAEFALTAANWMFGGHDKAEAAKLEPWGLPEVVPKQIVTPEGAKVSGTKRGRGVEAPDANDSDDLLDMWDDNDEEDEETEKMRLLGLRTEALRTAENSDMIDKVTKRVQEGTISEAKFMQWLEKGEERQLQKAKKVKREGGKVGELSGMQGLMIEAGVAPTAQKSAADSELNQRLLMLAKSCGGANGGVFTQVMEGGSAGSHNAGSAAQASSEETKKMQAIMMRDRASVALRDKGTLREVVMQTKMVRLQEEFDRTKAKVEQYQGEFRTKALLQLDLWWQAEYQTAQLGCDMTECGDNQTVLKAYLDGEIKSKMLDKQRVLEYLMRIEMANEAAKTDYEKGAEFLRLHERDLKGAAMRDTKGEALMAEAERKVTAKKKLEVQAKTLQMMENQARGGAMQFVNQFGMQAEAMDFQQGWVDRGKAQGGRFKPVGAPGGANLQARRDENGKLGSFRKGGVFGERKEVQWVDAGVWRADLAGKLAPAPGTFTTDTRYQYNNDRRGVVNPENRGPMTCDICGQKGHGQAECGADYTGQPMQFERGGKTYLTWQFLNKERVCNAKGEKRR